MTPLAATLALVRPDILALAPYSSARKESSGGRIWLDANENPETPAASLTLNRYPEPQPRDLVTALATLYGVTPAQTIVTRGSDEGIDLLLRTFCRASQDAILITPPTYGMYVVAAGIQGARVVAVPLIREQNFALNTDAVIAAALAEPATKLVFLCTPNNPTGNLLDRAAVMKVVHSLAGRAVVVADEAYVDFSGQPSLAAEISANPNLIVLRTLSKAFGLAGARVGTTIADPAIIAVLQKVIAPYPIPVPVLTAALTALSPDGQAAARTSVASLIAERARLVAALPKLPVVKRVWPSDTNYLLIEVADSARTMAAGRAAGVIWRDRSKDVPNTVRITVGTPAENTTTLEVLARV
jgi:histidinol-phosphate aminotransferase